MNTDLPLPFLAQTETGAYGAHSAVPSASPESAPPPSAMGGFGQMLPLVLIFAILYFIMIRPAQRKEKERKKEIDQMRTGTKVLFGGGIIGVITEVRDTTFLVQVADGVVLEIARGAVQRIVSGDTVPATGTDR